MKPHRPRPRLYVITPQLDDVAAFAGALEHVLAAGDIAAVLLRLADADERTLVERAKTIARVVQHHDVALLIDGRPEIVTYAGADGAHLTGIEALRAAIAALKPDRIAGAGGLRSRHDAMLAGEAHADYVMFGEPLPGAPRNAREDRARDGRPSFPALLDRLAWWAELFQPPCVGYAASAEETSPLAQAGADFIALGDWIWVEPGGPAAAVAAAQEIAAECRGGACPAPTG